MQKQMKYRIALCALLVPGLAMAANFIPASGDYSVAGNWDTALVPGAGETAAVGGVKVATVSTTESIGSIHMTSGGAFTISAGGTLTASAQALVGNGSTGSILVDGGVLSIGTEFALGVGGGAVGTVTLNSGSLTSLSLLGVGWGGGSGTLTVNGGVANLNQLTLGSFGGNGDIIINGGSVFASGNLNGTSAGGVGTVVINGGELSANALAFGIGGTQSLDLNGGQIIARSAGFSQVASSTFNIGDGELIFQGATVAAVDSLIDTGGGTWIFDGSGSRSVTDDGLGNITVTSIPEPATMGLIALFGGAVLASRRLFR